MRQISTAFSATILRISLAAITVVVLFQCAAVAVASPAAGWLDRSFGNAGKVTTNVANNQAARSGRFSDFRGLDDGFTVTLQAGDGQEPLRVLRFNPDGSLDPGYAAGARAPDGILPLGQGRITRTLPDGRTLVAGSDSGRAITLQRYLKDGTLDSGFGRDGLVRISFGRSDWPGRLVIGSTGEILLQAVSSGGGEMSTSFPLVLLDGNGQVLARVDQERGYGNIVAADDGSFRATEASWSDGDEDEAALYRIDRQLKVTTIRMLNQENPEWFGPVAMLPGNGFLAFRYGSGQRYELVRVNPDGTVDSGYNATTCTEPASGYPVNRSIEIDGEGRALVAGLGGCPLVRVLPNGGLDPAFGTDGVAELPPFDDDPSDSLPGSPFDWSATLLVDGRVQLLRWNYEAGQIFTARLTADGKTDSSFDREPITIRQASFDTARAVLATGRGYVVIGNSRCNLSGLVGGPCQGLGLVAYRKSGRLDRAFGADGRQFESRLTGEAVARVSGGRFVVAGSSNDGTKITLARFTNDGQLDRSFGDDGVATVTVPGRVRDAGARAVLALPDGKLVVTGVAKRKGTGTDIYLPVLRFLPDGQLDPAFGDGGLVTLRQLGLGTAIDRIGRDYVIAASRGLRPAVMRLKANGELRKTFGERGVVTPKLALRSRLNPRTRFTKFRNTNTLKVTADGILGVATDGYGMFGSALFKLRRNGTRDRGFGRRGVAWVGGLVPGAISIDRCRRITLAGTWRRKANGARSFALLRLTRSGSPDRSLANGRLATPFGRSNGSVATATSSGHPRRTVVAGSRSSDITSSDFALAAVRNPACRHARKR